MQYGAIYKSFLFDDSDLYYAVVDAEREGECKWKRKVQENRITEVSHQQGENKTRRKRIDQHKGESLTGQKSPGIQ